MFFSVIIVLTLIDNNRWAIKTEQLEEIFTALTVSYVWVGLTVKLISIIYPLNTY